MARHLSVIVILAVATFLGVSFLMSFGGNANTVPQVFTSEGSFGGNIPSEAKTPVKPVEPVLEGSTESKLAGLDITSDLLSGDVVMPKLENATAKAELGRAAWKVIHTMMGRFPDKPTEDDQLTLKTYIQLFARLYPCGDCARHFQQLLKKYPPQVSSRNAAAGWACFVHNQVNERLGHEIFDCAKIGDFYDCGCGDEKKEDAEGATGELKKEGLSS